MKTQTEVATIPARTCECGFYTARASAAPRPNDLTVCPGCGIALIFQANLVLRPLNGDDMDRIAEEDMKRLDRLRQEILAQVEERGMGGYN
jgi:hypothetical protein